MMGQMGLEHHAKALASEMGVEWGKLILRSEQLGVVLRAQMPKLAHGL